MVSLIISMPDFVMNMEIRTPTYASKLSPVDIYMTADTKTDSERTASNNASEPDDTSELEFILLPTLFTYLPKKNFTMTAPPMIISDTAE